MSTDGYTDAELLVCVVKSHGHVEEILTGFLELGVRGATVSDVKGMGQIISFDIPIFAGFKSLFPGGGANTYMILSVIEKNLLSRAVQLVEEICGAFKTPGTGFLFTVPVTCVKGMAEEIS